MSQCESNVLRPAVKLIFKVWWACVEFRSLGKTSYHLGLSEVFEISCFIRCIIVEQVSSPEALLLRLV